MSIKVIYLPGIGDHSPYFQDKIIKLWRPFGLGAEYHKVGWALEESFASKLQKIIDRIDELTKGGDRVALVGVSAGASAALNAYMSRKDKISAVVFICGKVHGLDNINPNYFQKNPAFKESLEMSNATYHLLSDGDRQKMLYIYSRTDMTVPVRANRMVGVREKKILAVGHISAIYLTIIFHTSAVSRFIKSVAKTLADE